MKAEMAVSAGAKAYGFAIRYPDGSFVSGEHVDLYEFLCGVESLLQNGFRWTAYTAVRSPFDTAIWFLCARFGADYYMTDDPMLHVTDPQLRKAGMWRRGLPAANNAARILFDEEEDE